MTSQDKVLAHFMGDGKNFTLVQKMLLGIAIGDAFGAGYEFVRQYKRDQQQEVDITKYRAHPSPKYQHKEGMYTDDTQMSIAVAELLLSGKEFNLENLADFFLGCYKRDPIVGYAKGFQGFLDSVSTKEQFLQRIISTLIRNGAAMRAVPLGIIDDPTRVIEYAITNASITHNTPNGIASSVIVSLLSHYNIYERRILAAEELVPHVQGIDSITTSYLERVAKMDAFNPELLFGQEDKDKGVPCDGMRTAGAVFYLLSHFTEPKDILREGTKLGGDVDSVLSISLGINLMHQEVSDLPQPLYDGLTNHAFGRDYLLQLGEQLGRKFPVL